MTRPVVFFGIQGKDPKKLQDFYKQLFGWKIDASGPVGGMVEHGIGGPPEGIGGIIMQADAPSVTIHVQVLDLVETLAKAESLGGKAVMQPIDVPGGPTVAQIADPEGNAISLVKQ
ncbi:MAG: VOC family protein [Chloroflexi bacterium]|nr:VOC family protein [Chloroflexota bacterium]